MNTEDAVLFYGSSAVVLLFNILLLRKRRIQGVISIGIQLVYTAYFNYELQFDSNWGAGLAWWFYLIVLNCAHFLVLIVLLATYFIADKRRN